jgi:hypothetical protein
MRTFDRMIRVIVVGWLSSTHSPNSAEKLADSLLLGQEGHPARSFDIDNVSPMDNNAVATSSAW